MGIGSSTGSPPSDVSIELQHKTKLTQKNINDLWRRYCELRQPGRDKLTTEDLRRIKQVMVNPVAERVVRIFVQNSTDGTISFLDFAKTIAVFHPQTDAEVKLRFAFDLYDSDGGGTVDEAEMFDVLRKLSPENMADDQVSELVMRTIREVDEDGSGELEFDEFKTVMQNVDVGTIMRIHI
eukprot:TRINITY_DN74157_c0_g1_i1.p1 TRINITY_DN74157_c0_g1~~TRINITY_DN74157_c0_g1_i1.p1  ORF type:complete len:198 (+),score=38.77 TRINITY_DN74157_c0_g1_i1:53-595(+)